MQIKEGSCDGAFQTGRRTFAEIVKPVTKKSYSVKEAAEYLSISIVTLLWVSEGFELTIRRMPGRWASNAIPALATRCYGYTIGDKSDEGQDAPWRVEMGNTN